MATFNSDSRRGRTHPSLSILSGLLVALLAIALVYESTPEAAAAEASGTATGSAFTVNGSILSHSINVNPVNLPPGGTAGAFLNARVGTVNLTADAVNVSCSSTAAADSITASCLSQVDGLALRIAGRQILSATTVRAQSNTTAYANGATSSSTGTIIQGLCVVRILGGHCAAVAGEALVQLNIAGVVSGTVEVNGQEPRASGDGSGLGVTMLHLDLDTLLEGIVVLDVVSADSFAGGFSNPTPAGQPGLQSLQASPSQAKVADDAQGQSGSPQSASGPFTTTPENSGQPASVLAGGQTGSDAGAQDTLAAGLLPEAGGWPGESGPDPLLLSTIAGSLLVAVAARTLSRRRNTP